MMNADDRGQPGRDDPAGPLFPLRHVTQERGDTTILRDVTLHLPRTEVTVRIGPSGADGTSLIRLLDRLGDPSSPEVLLLDEGPIHEVTGTVHARPQSSLHRRSSPVA
jgi:ABC-type transporter Mla maintaining outer membrane lipid asymmetry ATPase subunit MlaF